MQFKTAFFALLAAALTEAAELEKRACPGVHVFGARETTVSPGYGTAGVVVNLVLNAYSGSTAEAITYPACGGQSSCGGISYSSSVQQGTQNVATQVNSFNQQCPSTQLVLVGYSQGAEIMDNAFCGGGDSGQGVTNTAVLISSAAIQQIKAVIMMGNPRRAPGLSYNVGTCNGSGFSPRPSGFQCPSASKIQSYCDSADQYCCSGSDTSGATHQGYGNEYGQAALTFIKGKLSATSSTGQQSTQQSTQQQSTQQQTSQNNGGTCSAKWGQCGGQGYSGPTCCQSGSTCKYSNAWYSQCL